MRRRRQRRSRWALFLLLSALLNWGGLLLFVWLFWSEPATPTTITYLDLSQVEPEREIPEPTEPKEEPDPALEPEPPDEPPEPRPEPRRVRKKKEPKLELEELPEPEEEKEEKKEEPKEKEEPKDESPVEPQHFVLEQLKMVEQPDEFDEAEVPDTYDYLSNVNRNVEVQTRARMTNLERDAVTPKARQQEASAEKTPGTADRQKIAQQVERKSRLDKKAPKVERSREEKRQAAPDRRRSLLAMRDLEPRRHRLAEDANDPMAAPDEAGELGRKQQRRDTVVRADAPGASREPSPVARFRLSRNDLDALYGKEVEARRDMLSAQASKQRGIWDGPRDHWQSPLENMVPEVRPGNQTALRSRKHPFARYIATIHRSIHESWAWGFLDQLDMRGNGHPLNRRDLWTRLEIVLNGDGTIAKVTTVRPSGNLVFDAAARETVWAVGPFPPPPRSIVSPDGRVYIHWAFHRDERACGTFGATPFILDGTGGDRPDPNVEVRPVRGAARRLARGPQARGGAAPMGPAPPPSPAPPPGPAPSTGSKPAGPQAGASPPPGAGPGAGSPGTPAPADPAAAKKVADAWLHYLATGDLERLAARSGLPFLVSGRPVARTRKDLVEVLRSLVGETKVRPKASKVMTAAQLRKLLGGVPAGVLEGSPALYAVTRIGDEILILVLDRPLGSYRVVGIAR